MTSLSPHESRTSYKSSLSIRNMVNGSHLLHQPLKSNNASNENPKQSRRASLMSSAMTILKARAKIKNRKMNEE